MAGDPAPYLKRMSGLKAARTTAETNWQQVADYMLPSREFTRLSPQGSKRAQPLIFNTAPILANEQLAGALHGMLTSPSLRWFALRPDDIGLVTDSDARAWFEDATDRMYSVFNAPDSGFDTSLHELYLELCGFGTGAMFIADRGRLGPRYQSRPLGECLMSEGADGRIDTVYRCYKLPIREVVRLWPAEADSDMKDLAESNPDAPQEILHAVQPSGNDDGRWMGAYCLVRKKDPVLFEEETFQSFPFACPRWLKRSGEIYGYGPAMNALPDVKLLNKIEEIQLRGLAKTIDPPLMMPDDGFLSALNLNPGKVNFYRSGMAGQDRIGPIETGTRMDIGRDEVQMIEKRIERMFYVDWLSLPQQPNMTATEVLQRRDQMLRLLGPMVSRITAELLGPTIERTFAVMAANGLLPQAPQILAGRGYRVEYLGPLAVAQKASDAETVIRWIGALAQLAQVDPTVMQVVNAEAAARFLADRFGAPAHVVRPAAELAAIRAQAEQQQAAQHEMAATQAAAGAAKDGTQALGNVSDLLQKLGGNGAPQAAAA